MDGVTIILGLVAVSVLAIIVLWFTRNKGVVGNRVVVGESTPKITIPRDDSGETDPVNDWEIIPVTRTRRPRGHHQEMHDENVTIEPLLEPLSNPDSETAVPLGMDTVPDKPEELIVVLNIIANQEQWLMGTQVVNAVCNAGMQYGDPGIFHYILPENPQSEPLFSLANILNPGVFQMSKLEQLTTPGVTLFMRVTDTAGTTNGLDAFTHMHDTAQQLAHALNAEVYDERRQLLTEVAISRLRDRIARYQNHPDVY